MAREWDSVCGDCGKPFSFSQATFMAGRLRGERPPPACFGCAKEYLRERRALGRTAADRPLPPDTPPAADPPGRAGPAWGGVDHPTILHEKRGEFGVSDDKLVEFFRKLDDPLAQVILVEAPTGAGKSTFFPYRLLVPPPGVPDPEVFTRNGQIVVTQPRVQATRNIPGFVSRLHGCRLGAGFDIGFRHAKEHAADWRCKLVYLTDGTLINWIATGQLGNISLVMLDEAHERSLNIDLIIGLLTQVLPRYPWLKLVIASATIDAAKFKAFFDRHLRGGARCEQVVFEGKPGKPVRKHFRCGHAQWEDPLGNVQRLDPDAPAAPLAYHPDDLKELLKDVPKKLGEKCVELLVRMHPTTDEKGAETPGDLADSRGDVLGFLYGKKSIEEAAGVIRAAVAANPALKGCVDVLPLYTTLPQDEQRKALAKPTPGRVRVILSTNVAETSLTLEGIKHVVETGLINRKVWNTELETGAVRQYLHSQAGCRQRWGRAGRVSEGDAWCLYTKEQFDQFPRDTVPSVLTSQLEPIVLTAKAAGVDDLSAEVFPWLDPPPADELKRAVRRLRQHGALDADGDLTPHGSEIQRFGSDVRSASLLILADRFACAVEVATVLPFIEGGGKSLLLTDRDLDATTAHQVRRVHAALTWGCRDDLELVLKVFAAWSEARGGGERVCGSWAWPKVWAARRPAMPAGVRAALGGQAAAVDQRAAELADAAAAGRFVGEVPNVPGGRAWAEGVRAAFGPAAGETWAKLWFVNDTRLRELEKGRDEKIEQLAVRKKEKERRPINFEALDRVRVVLAWASADLCFLRTDGRWQDRPLYDRLADLREAARRTPPAYGGSPVESDDGGEDEWSEPAVLLDVGDRSHCHGQSLDALIGFGSMTRANKPHPNADELAFVNATFVVRVDRAVLEDLPEGGVMELAAFLAERHPPPSPDDTRTAGPTRKRLFVDQQHPVFGQYECRPLGQLGERRWEVELTSAGTFWPASRAVEIPSAADEEEGETPAEASTEICADIMVDLLNDARQPSTDPAGGSPTEDADDSDADPPDADGAAPTAPPALASELDVPLWEPIRAVLDTTADALAGPVEAEVTGYEADGERPALVLTSPTPEMCFDKFFKRFQVGDRVTVVAVGTRRVGGAVGLRVREPDSGYETELMPDDLSFVTVPGLAEQFPADQPLTVAFESLDTTARAARLSLLPLVEEAQHALRAEAGGMFTALGEIVDTRKNHVRFRLDPAQFGMPAAALLAAELFQPDGRGRLPLQVQVGRQCNIQVKFRLRESVPAGGRATANGPGAGQPLADLMPELVARANAIGIPLEWDAQEQKLGFNPQRHPHDYQWFTGERRRRAYELATHVGFRGAIDRLYRRMNTLRADPADLDLEARNPVGMRVRGVMKSLGQPGEKNGDGKLLLDSGLTAFIPANEFAPGHAVRPGAVAVATVVYANGRQQRVTVTLRPPAEAAGEIRWGLLCEVAERCRLRDPRGNMIKLTALPPQDRAAIPRWLTEACGVYPWLCWAKLTLDAPTHTGVVLGPQHSARLDIERECGVVMSADAGTVYLLAGHADDLGMATEGVRRRLSGKSEVNEERVYRGELAIAADDLYLDFRTAPLAQVAGTTSEPPVEPAAAARLVRGRLRGVVAELTRAEVPR